ncbi:probable palmitoyltransferase ZDHHC24 [Drosophila rhopaloa]|uniref:Palmitoyltransferase n=1 Tax=Drosophila rhopaloa TaxID=1041015 RepID=A0ABM5J7Y1_DRORH|nr:probable palmitoyltransferase ZDHHC24 [Drosophila rhopaloa]
MCIVTELCHNYAKRYPHKFVSIGHPSSVILVMFYITPIIFNGLLYKISWVVATFITYNILGNMLFCYSTNTSVECLPKDRQLPVPGEENLWHYCEICQKLMPPRSWHCALCRCCILKRDHHCIFAATCIGHNNHRYFFWFTFYLTIGTALSLATSLIYAVMSGSFLPWLIIKDSIEIKGIFSSYCQYLIFILNNLACGVPAIMLAFQIQIIYLNASYYEINNRSYNLGFRKNCKLIMGQRGLWTFLSPSLKSPLPHDGTQWQMKPKD